MARLIKIKYSYGFSLVETMVATALTLVVVSAMAQFWAHNSKLRKRERYRQVMARVAHDIESKVQTPQAIYLSLYEESNGALIKCLIGADEGCTEGQTNPSSETKFSLVYPNTRSTFSMVTHALGSISYNTKGLPCSVPDQDSCVFSAETYFYASCPRDSSGLTPTSCLLGARDVHVGYRVNQRAGSLERFGARLPQLPVSKVLFSISATDLFGPEINSECNQGAIIKGYSSSGKAVCTCSAPYIQRTIEPFVNRRGPLCQQIALSGFSCPEGKVFRGLQGDGSADCRDFDDAFECRVNTGIAADVSGWCGDPQFWLALNAKTECTYRCQIAKGGGTCLHDGTAPANMFNAGDGIGCLSREIHCCRPKY